MEGMNTASLPDSAMIDYDCFDQKRASDASEIGREGSAAHEARARAQV
jgi:hypothetical protein